MKKIYIPKNIALALKLLNTKGKAYIVGGCVRDALLGIIPSDYDITTSLEPAAVKEIFKAYKQIDNNGEKHGTITVLIAREKIEITSFRQEGSYLDGRHPSFVKFTTSLEEDLKRRDFTINAMAYNEEEGLIDLYGGIKDLEAGIIRTVGNPYQRLSEDYLRILRALRFSGRFNFIVDSKTKEAMLELAPGLVKISKERIYNELKEILISKNILEMMLDYQKIMTTLIPELKAGIAFDQLNKWHSHDVYTHIAYVMQNTSCDLDLRLAALLHDISKPYCFQEEVVTGKVVRHFRGHATKAWEMAKIILPRLCVPKSRQKEVLFLILYHDFPLVNKPKVIKKILSLCPSENRLSTFTKFIALKKADASDHQIKDNDIDFEEIVKSAERIIKMGEAITLSDLAIKGNDLLALGFKGQEIQVCLKELLALVWQNNQLNNKEYLLKAAINRPKH